MSRVLTSPALDVAPREVSRPDPACDPFVQALAEQAAAEAYARGHTDGAAAAVAAAAAAGAQAAAGVRAALADALAARRAARLEESAATAELALAIAVTVLGREPHDGGAALTARLTDTLARLDDDALSVLVSPCDTEVVAAALDGEAGVQVRADATLRPGEARVRGVWARADLTHDAALRAVTAALEAGVPAGEVPDAAG